MGKNYLTTSGFETKKLGQKLAKQLKAPVIAALISDLGGGKTTLVQGIAKGLGIKTKVTSPTFVLERIYSVPNKKWMLYHYDLYRIQPDDILIAEILENAQHNLVLIEWAEKIESLLPASAIKIRIKMLGDDQRKITITNL